MNTFFSRHFQQINWSATTMFALGFWLSSSLVFDCLVIPGLLSSGMMSQDGFATAGYTIFGTFNHIELICAALVLAGRILVCSIVNGLASRFVVGFRVFGVIFANRDFLANQSLDRAQVSLLFTVTE